MTTSLFIVRHGESTWNAERRWQGRADPPLSARGEDQARAAATALATLGRLDAVVTSSLNRARRTGELIARAAAIELGEPIADLSERSAGPWEGLTRAEIEIRDPGFLGGDLRPDGYEADESVVRRALAAIEMLAGAHPGGRVLVVSHGGVIHALERHTGAESGQWLRLDNLEGRWFAHADGVLQANGPRVHLLDPDLDTSDTAGYA